MNAIEFITTPNNNIINIPSKYSNLNNHSVKVVIVQDDNIECVSDQEQKFYEKALSSLSDDDKDISSSKVFSL